jgi:hypothetical protein
MSFWDINKCNIQYGSGKEQEQRRRDLLEKRKAEAYGKKRKADAYGKKRPIVEKPPIMNLEKQEQRRAELLARRKAEADGKKPPVREKPPVGEIIPIKGSEFITLENKVLELTKENKKLNEDVKKCESNARTEALKIKKQLDEIKKISKEDKIKLQKIDTDYSELQKTNKELDLETKKHKLEVLRLKSEIEDLEKDTDESEELKTLKDLNERLRKTIIIERNIVKVERKKLEELSNEIIILKQQIKDKSSPPKGGPPSPPKGGPPSPPKGGPPSPPKGGPPSPPKGGPPSPPPRPLSAPKGGPPDGKPNILGLFNTGVAFGEDGCNPPDCSKCNNFGKKACENADKGEIKIPTKPPPKKKEGDFLDNLKEKFKGAKGKDALSSSDDDDDDEWGTKYLKYKIKYLNLKNKINN